MSVYDYEHELFKIDQNLAVFRDLKEMYIDFNNKYVGNPKEHTETVVLKCLKKLQILWITTKSKF